MTCSLTMIRLIPIFLYQLFSCTLCSFTFVQKMTAHGCPFEELGFDSIAELLQRVPGIDVSKPPDSVSLWCSVPHPSLTARQNHLILQRE